ncbi:uncharacterized protein [Musca autumnalis]|uniref:uncharacterized protein n=1 Tax=Musca autumnalis TaxID=221902 RepID=UPI003CF82DF4
MKISIILLCLAGLAAGRVIVQRPPINVQQVVGKRNVIGHLYTMTRDELLRQKFILDVLKQIELPMQDIKEISKEDIIDENIYVGPLDNDMQLMLELIRDNRMLQRNMSFSITNEMHLRQLIGLYRLFVRCRDFEMLQRLAILARQTINPVLFVNALTLALEDRHDTQMLIVPALYEILPQTYINKNSIIRSVENVESSDRVMQRNLASSRPNILDIIDTRDMTVRNNQGSVVVDRDQLWMPWRDVHHQLSLQNRLGDRNQMDISISPRTDIKGLISEDFGLRAFLNILIDELIINHTSEDIVIANDQTQQVTDKLIGKSRMRLTDILMPQQRAPRSILANVAEDNQKIHLGQLVIHHLKQILARLNIERISLQKIDNTNVIDDNMEVIKILDLLDVNREDKILIQNKLSMMMQMGIINREDINEILDVMRRDVGMVSEIGRVYKIEVLLKLIMLKNVDVRKIIDIMNIDDRMEIIDQVNILNRMPLREAMNAMENMEVRMKMQIINIMDVIDSIMLMDHNGGMSNVDKMSENTLETIITDLLDLDINTRSRLLNKLRRMLDMGLMTRMDIMEIVEVIKKLAMLQRDITASQMVTKIDVMLKLIMLQNVDLVRIMDLMTNGDVLKQLNIDVYNTQNIKTMNLRERITLIDQINVLNRTPLMERMNMVENTDVRIKEGIMTMVDVIDILMEMGNIDILRNMELKSGKTITTTDNVDILMITDLLDLDINTRSRLINKMRRMLDVGLMTRTDIMEIVKFIKKAAMLQRNITATQMVTKIDVMLKLIMLQNVDLVRIMDLVTNGDVLKQLNIDVYITQNIKIMSLRERMALIDQINVINRIPLMERMNMVENIDVRMKEGIMTIINVIDIIMEMGNIDILRNIGIKYGNTMITMDNVDISMITDLLDLDNNTRSRLVNKMRKMIDMGIMTRMDIIEIVEVIKKITMLQRNITATQIVTKIDVMLKLIMIQNVDVMKIIDLMVTGDEIERLNIDMYLLRNIKMMSMHERMTLIDQINVLNRTPLMDRINMMESMYVRMKEGIMTIMNVIDIIMEIGKINILRNIEMKFGNTMRTIDNVDISMITDLLDIDIYTRSRLINKMRRMLDVGLMTRMDIMEIVEVITKLTMLQKNITASQIVTKIDLMLNLIMLQNVDLVRIMDLMTNGYVLKQLNIDVDITRNIKMMSLRERMTLIDQINVLNRTPLMERMNMVENIDVTMKEGIMTIINVIDIIMEMGNIDILRNIGMKSGNTMITKDNVDILMITDLLDLDNNTRSRLVNKMRKMIDIGIMTRMDIIEIVEVIKKLAMLHRNITATQIVTQIDVMLKLIMLQNVDLVRMMDVITTGGRLNIDMSMRERMTLIDQINVINQTPLMERINIMENMDVRMKESIITIMNVIDNMLLMDDMVMLRNIFDMRNVDQIINNSDLAMIIDMLPKNERILLRDQMKKLINMGMMNEIDINEFIDILKTLRTLDKGIMANKIDMSLKLIMLRNVNVVKILDLMATGDVMKRLNIDKEMMQTINTISIRERMSLIDQINVMNRMSLIERMNIMENMDVRMKRYIMTIMNIIDNMMLKNDLVLLRNIVDMKNVDKINTMMDMTSNNRRYRVDKVDLSMFIDILPMNERTLLNEKLMKMIDIGMINEVDIMEVVAILKNLQNMDKVVLANKIDMMLKLIMIQNVDVMKMMDMIKTSNIIKGINNKKTIDMIKKMVKLNGKERIVLVEKLNTFNQMPLMERINLIESIDKKIKIEIITIMDVIDNLIEMNQFDMLRNVIVIKNVNQMNSIGRINIINTMNVRNGMDLTVITDILGINMNERIPFINKLRKIIDIGMINNNDILEIVGILKNMRTMEQYVIMERMDIMIKLIMLQNVDVIKILDMIRTTDIMKTLNMNGKMIAIMRLRINSVKERMLLIDQINILNRIPLERRISMLDNMDINIKLDILTIMDVIDTLIITNKMDILQSMIKNIGQTDSIDMIDKINRIYMIHQKDNKLMMNNMGRINLMQQNIGMTNNMAEITNNVDAMEGVMQEISLRLEQKLSAINNQKQLPDYLRTQQINQVILNEVLQQIIQISKLMPNIEISNLLDNPMIATVLQQIINTIEQQQTQQLEIPYECKIEEIARDSVTINNLKIDELRTFVEETPLDLSNTLRNGKNIIGLTPRLNHKAFTINIDITSERQQHVIIRTLLIPKLHALMTIEEQRRNALVLDIFDVDLRQGRNVISRNSLDINWTGRDVTLYRDIYERVMRAIEGNIDLTIDSIVGQTTLMPHRLLLPRGRVEGLPMQIMVIITPVEGNKLISRQPTHLGMDSLILDNLPLIYPLDCGGMVNIENVGQLSNIILKDVMIYHNDENVM